MINEADDQITWLVQTLAENPDASSAAVGLMVERLRRMEDEARLGGADRQILQRIMSGRRVLGDRANFSAVDQFLPKGPIRRVWDATSGRCGP